MQQFWAWMEVNRLYPFMQERDDWRMGTVASVIYNTNIVDKDKMTTAGDFAYPTMDEIIAKEEERGQEQVDEPDTNEEQKKVSILAWNERIAQMTTGRKVMQDTIKG